MQLQLPLHATLCATHDPSNRDKIQGTTVPIDGGFLALTRYEPIGVCAQIIVRGEGGRHARALARRA